MFVFKELDDRLDAEQKNVKTAAPASNYRDKYKHLIGDEAAKDAAKNMTANKSYGFGAYRLDFHQLIIYNLNSLSLLSWFFFF